jgi:hypothetical protein
MSGEAVTKQMGVDAFLDTRSLGGLMTGVPNGFHVDRPITAIVAGKQPGAGFPMVEPPLGPQCHE